MGWTGPTWVLLVGFEAALLLNAKVHANALRMDGDHGADFHSRVAFGPTIGLTRKLADERIGTKP